ncbi:MAG: hypothetical protein R2795_13875 [Saprospiraceae bacterium]
MLAVMDGINLDDFSPTGKPILIFNIDLMTGDPEVFNNNIPLQGCTCPTAVEAGMGQTICTTATVNLTTIGASITPPH